MTEVDLILAGIATGPEVFNAIMRNLGRPLSKLGQLQVCPVHTPPC
jgi:hypothetical protein